jgi:2-dehydro-3-deoxyphosphogluconate aldolase/(4S)-4-hydroxy-2-oxoglutarate aldolase
MIPGEVVAMMARRRLVAEVRTETAKQALGTIEALVAGGIASIEVSLAIPGAEEILSVFAARSDMLVGAGGVLDARQASEAISHGARFITSPIHSAEIVPVCRDANIACVLGALTPTEIIAAQRAGAEMVKLFPVQALGGPHYVRALFEQLTHMSLQVSGGISAESFGAYLSLPVRAIALGSVLIPKQLVEHGSWQALTNRARAFVDYANHPHEFAARFLAMMGIAPQQPLQPQMLPSGLPQMLPGAMPAPGLAPAALPAPAGALNGAADYGPDPSFRPWDSRPVENGEEEDWLR